jgi:hypothetical protein
MRFRSARHGRPWCGDAPRQREAGTRRCAWGKVGYGDMWRPEALQQQDNGKQIVQGRARNLGQRLRPLPVVSPPSGPSSYLGQAEALRVWGIAPLTGCLLPASWAVGTRRRHLQETYNRLHRMGYVFNR